MDKQENHNKKKPAQKQGQGQGAPLDDRDIFELPNCKDMEAELIGMILLDNNYLDHTMVRLKVGDFFDKKHRIIYSQMLKMYALKIPIDILTLCDELKRSDQLEQVAGMAYVVSCINGVHRTVNVIRWILRIKQTSIARQVLTETEKARLATIDGEDINQVMHGLNKKISELQQADEIEPTVRLIEVVRERIERAEKLSETDRPLTGIPSGFTELDAITTGFQKSDLIIIAARPSVGKTSMILNMAEYMARNGYTPGIISLEMSKEHLADRLICQVGNLDSHRFRGNYLSKEDWARLGKARQEISDFPKQILIDDKVFDTESFRYLCKRWRAEVGLDVLFVDYLGLARLRRRVDNREQEVAGITRDLKALGKEFDIPVIAPSQLSRDIEKRADDEPKLSDLRSSGEIEQTSDLVIFLDREVLKNKENPERNTKCKVIIAKQRNGPTGRMILNYRPEFTRFENPNER